jgi:hypothetical protein
MLYFRFLNLALHLKEKGGDRDSLLLAALSASFHGIDTSAIRTWLKFVPLLRPDELELKITERLFASQFQKGITDGCSRSSSSERRYPFFCFP